MTIVWPPLCSGQSSLLQIQRLEFNSRHYQVFREVVGLEQGLESQEHGQRDLSRWQHDTLYTQKLTLTLPTRGSRLVGIVCSWTQATEFDDSAKLWAYNTNLTKFGCVLVDVDYWIVKMMMLPYHRDTTLPECWRITRLLLDKKEIMHFSVSLHCFTLTPDTSMDLPYLQIWNFRMSFVSYFNCDWLLYYFSA
jgi:hypothetical protein